MNNDIVQIVLNGEVTNVKQDATLSELLQMLKLQDKRIAIEVNQQVIPRSQHISFILSANDHVEIIHAVGGG